MVAILRIEYFNKNEEQFAIDVSGYKTYKHFIKAYRSFVNRCNNDGYGTSLLYVGGYFKLHECEETQVVISNKNITNKISSKGGIESPSILLNIVIKKLIGKIR